MTYEELNNMIAGLGLPYAYNEFPNNTRQAPPFICFLLDDTSQDLMADNKNYAAIRPLTIELYTDNKDFDLEQTIEAALTSAGLAFSRGEAFIEGERMYQITYETEVYINNA